MYIFEGGGGVGGVEVVMVVTVVVVLDGRAGYGAK